MSDFTPSQKVNGRFINPWRNFPGQPGLGAVLKFVIADKDRSGIPSAEELNVTLPIIKPKEIVFKPSPEKLQYTWIGHATGLVQLDNFSFLTDPIFSDRAFAVSFLGPKRYRPVPITIAELPKIDAVVISHNHYDHLDMHSVQQLSARFPDLVWFVGLGTRDLFLHQGIPGKNVVELDWWQEHVHQHDGNEFRFVFTPAQHWCKRGLFDDNKCLWGSWTVIGPSNKRFYFAGDTGYCEAFEQIGRRYGPFNLAAIPIGAYEPRNFMMPAHINPQEAVQVHLDVRARRSIGIHFGTFRLTYEPYLEPPRLVQEALAEKNMNPDEFVTVHHGETLSVD